MIVLILLLVCVCSLQHQEKLQVVLSLILCSSIALIGIKLYRVLSIFHICTSMVFYYQINAIHFEYKMVIYMCWCMRKDILN